MRKINCVLLVFLLATTTSFAQIDLKNGLIACYPFNGNARDESGNDNNGTINGATLITDRFGKANSAYNFDGGSYIAVSPNQFTNESYTYSVWVNLDAVPSEEDNNTFVAIGGPGADQVLSCTNNYSTLSAKGFQSGGYNVGNPVISNNWTGVLPTLNRWYHVLVTRDNVSLKLYVDGILINNNLAKNSTGGTDAAYANPTYVTIGSRVGADGYFQSLRGSLDDIYIYNRAITAEEVTALYQATKSPRFNYKNGLVAFYPFNNNAIDETGNGNDGSVNGATITSDRFGKINSAYSFNGVDNFILINADQLQNNEYTYSLWIKPLSIQEGNTNYLFSIGSQGIDGGGQGIAITERTPNGNNGFIGGGNIVGKSDVYCQTNTFPNTDNWYHLVLTKNKDSHKLYMNGNLMCSSPSNGNNPTYGISEIRASIGNRVGFSGQFVHGIIDDVYIYNRAITFEEVTTLYEKTPCEEGVMACHPFTVLKTK
jgi:hypothetical protein